MGRTLTRFDVALRQEPGGIAAWMVGCPLECVYLFRPGDAWGAIPYEKLAEHAGWLVTIDIRRGTIERIQQL
ncbi:MAG: hypothetical protein N3A38_11035 [Planctomycetota bacterium]|nr:hypothetical protein [Planctomycetota bacterium]